MTSRFIQHLLAPTLVLFGACAAPLTDEGDAHRESEQALCPLPGAPMSFGGPELLFTSSLQDQLQPSATLAGDFDGDGIPDAVAVDGWMNRVLTFSGRGDGTFSAARLSNAFFTQNPNVYLPQSAVAVDFDGDGDLDIAYAAQIGAHAIVALNAGNGTFTSSIAIPLTPYSVPKGITAGDFDGDGRQDLAVTLYATRSVQVILNKASGRVLPPAFTLPVGASAIEIAAADLDGDGSPDLVISSATGGQPKPVFIHRGLGDGTFAAVSTPLPKGQGINGPSTYGLVVTDLDADGKPDIAYVESTTHSVHAFRNTSTPGSLQLADEAQSGNGPWALSDALDNVHMVAGDLDADGKLDLAVSGKVFATGAKLHALKSASSPGFLSFASAGGPWSVNVGGSAATEPRGMASSTFDAQSCSALSGLVISSYDGSPGNWSVERIPNLTH